MPGQTHWYILRRQETEEDLSDVRSEIYKLLLTNI